MKGVRNIAVRGENAKNDFVGSIVEQFGFSNDDARVILGVYLDLNVAKIDYGIGQVKLAHGAYWDAGPLNDALEYHKTN